MLAALGRGHERRSKGQGQGIAIVRAAKSALFHVFFLLQAGSLVRVEAIRWSCQIAMQRVVIGDLRRLILQPGLHLTPHLAAPVDVPLRVKRLLTEVDRLYLGAVPKLLQPIDHTSATANVDKQPLQALALDCLYGKGGN